MSLSATPSTPRTNAPGVLAGDIRIFLCSLWLQKMHIRRLHAPVVRCVVSPTGRSSTVSVEEYKHTREEFLERLHIARAMDTTKCRNSPRQRICNATSAATSNSAGVLAATI